MQTITFETPLAIDTYSAFRIIANYGIQEKTQINVVFGVQQEIYVLEYFYSP